MAQEFLELLQKKLRKSDVIVQIKSDQFFVFLPIITEEEAKMVIDRINNAFDEGNTRSVKLQYVASHISFEE